MRHTLRNVAFAVVITVLFASQAFASGGGSNPRPDSSAETVIDLVISMFV